MNLSNICGFWPTVPPQWWRTLTHNWHRRRTRTARAAVNFAQLRERYAQPGAFLREMLLECVRYGASHISITWDPAQRTLSFLQGGPESPHLERLLELRHGDFDVEHLVQQHPFALGFCAVLAACSKIEIHTRTAFFLIDTAAFLRGEAPLRLPPSERSYDTRWVFWVRDSHCPQPRPRADLDRAQALTDTWEEMLGDLLRGFHHSVSFNKKGVPRPLALTQLQYECTELGELHMKPLTLDNLAQAPRLFCEGLPCNAQECTGSSVVLHLDPQQFPHLAGERSELTAEQRKRIATLLKDKRQHLLAWYQQTLPAQSFVEDYWQLCVQLEMPHLLAGMPLAHSMLSCYQRQISALHADRRHLGVWRRRRELPPANTLFVTDLQPEHVSRNGDSGAPLAALFAWAQQLPILDAQVPAAHPAHAWRVDLLDAGVRIVCEVEGAGAVGQFTGRFVSCRVQRCRAVILRLELTEHCTLRAQLRAALLALPPRRLTNLTVCDIAKGHVYVAGECAKFAEVPEQLYCYNALPEDEQWRAALDHDRRAFHLTVLSLAQS